MPPLQEVAETMSHRAGDIFAVVLVRLANHHRILGIPVRDTVTRDSGVTVTRDNIRAAALGTWLAALLYSRSEELDGFVPADAIENLATPDVITHLLRVGLLTGHEQNGIHGYLLLKYELFNETKAEVRSRRRSQSHRKRLSREGNTVTRDVNVGHAVVTRDRLVCHALTDTVTDTVEEKRDPPLASLAAPNGPVRRESIGHRLPAEDGPELDAFVRHWRLDVGHAQWPVFRDHWRGAAGAKARHVDWAAVWRNWLRRAPEFSRTQIRAIRPGTLVQPSEGATWKVGK